MTRILIVDNEPNALRALKEILGAEGYEVMTAENAEQALALAAQFRPHLLLTELRMRGLDGAELISKIGTLDRSICSLLMSAVDPPLKGASRFVKKPIDVDHLLEMLATAAAA